MDSAGRSAVINAVPVKGADGTMLIGFIVLLILPLGKVACHSLSHSLCGYG